MPSQVSGAIQRQLGSAPETTGVKYCRMRQARRRYRDGGDTDLSEAKVGDLGNYRSTVVEADEEDVGRTEVAVYHSLRRASDPSGTDCSHACNSYCWLIIYILRCAGMPARGPRPMQFAGKAVRRARSRMTAHAMRDRCTHSIRYIYTQNAATQPQVYQTHIQLPRDARTEDEQKTDLHDAVEISVGDILEDELEVRRRRHSEQPDEIGVLNRRSDIP